MRKRSGQVHSRESSATLQLTVSLLYHRKIIGGTFAENRVKYTVVCKDFRNNHGISDIGIERWTPV